MKAAIARGLGKRQGVWCVALAGALHLSASAQSTLALEMGPPPSQGPGVELYGLVDVAASYIDNQGGSSRLSQLGVGGDRGGPVLDDLDLVPQLLQDAGGDHLVDLVVLRKEYPLHGFPFRVG